MTWTVCLTIDTGGPEAATVWDCCELCGIDSALRLCGFNLEEWEGKTAHDIHPAAIRALAPLLKRIGPCRATSRFRTFLEQCRRHPKCVMEIVGR